MRTVPAWSDRYWELKPRRNALRQGCDPAWLERLRYGTDYEPTFADFKPVLAMLLPTIAYVILIKLIGIYVASALFIAGFMLFQGKYKWLPTLCVSLGVPGVIFALFEIWFLVPLPKGPLERMLGY